MTTSGPAGRAPAPDCRAYGGIVLGQRPRAVAPVRCGQVPSAYRWDDGRGTELDVSSFSRPVLAVDLGASRIRAGVVGPEGVVIARAERRTPLETGPSGVIAAIVELLGHVRDAAPAEVVREVAGVGIAAPGPLDAEAGVLVEPPNLGQAFHDAPLAEPIERAIGLPVAVARDTHAAAMAEWAFGAARGVSDFLYVTVSTGIGGAIVSGGRLVDGLGGFGGELGHLLVELDGPPCGCGGRGHLEAISSGRAIARAAEEAMARGAAPGLAGAAARLGRALAASDVATAEEEGDPGAAAIMAHARHAFAESCASLVDVFAPELIVVGGSIARTQGDRWLDPAREKIAATSFRVPRERVRVVPAALGDDVGLVGALPVLARRLPSRANPR